MDRQAARGEEADLTGIVDGESPRQEGFTCGDLLARTAREGSNSTINSARYLGRLGKTLVFNRRPRILEGVLAFGRSLFDIAGYMIEFNRDINSTKIPENDLERSQQVVDLGVDGVNLVSALAGTATAYALPFKAPTNPLAYIPAVVNTAGLIGRGIKHRKEVYNFFRNPRD